MQLDELKKHWNAFAKTDPFWAILTVPDKANGRWTREEFFATGKIEIDALMQSLAALDWNGRRGRALDFGCGAGKLLRHLLDVPAAGGELHGCDIDAPSIAWLDEHLSPPLQVFTVDEAPGLPRPDATFDLVLDVEARAYVPEDATVFAWREVARVLRPGGVYALNVIDYPPLGLVRAEAATLLVPTVLLVLFYLLTSTDPGGNSYGVRWYCLFMPLGFVFLFDTHRKLRSRMARAAFWTAYALSFPLAWIGALDPWLDPTPYGTGFSWAIVLRAHGWL